MELRTEVKVNQKDIDDLGHINHISYLSYLQDARMEWFSKSGLSMTEMNKRNIGPVILRLDILYHNEAKLDDMLKIVTRTTEVGKKSFIMKQDIYNQFNEHIAEATVTHVMFDTSLRKSIEVVDEISKRVYVNI